MIDIMQFQINENKKLLNFEIKKENTYKILEINKLDQNISLILAFMLIRKEQ